MIKKNLKLLATYFLGTLLSLSSCTFEQTSCEYKTVKVIQTSRAGDKLSEKGTYELSYHSSNSRISVKLDPKVEYQEILGFGGAFTESSASVLNKLSAEKRKEIIDAYFSKKESAYSLTRTHINSCDFSLTNYSYDIIAGDKNLDYFSIQEDMEDLIPLIQDAKNSEGADFLILASPWTAPPWMKDNNDWNDGSLLLEYYPTWAKYFVKYINAYKQQGIDIWGITVENEPEGNGGNWESMRFTPETMADFIKNYLGPEFTKNNLSTNILVYDQNRDNLRKWADSILNDKDAAKYVWGTAVHWYSSTYEWYPEELNYVHNTYPNKKLLHTESCVDSEIPHWNDDQWYWSKEATDWGWDWAPEKDKYLHPKYVPVFRYTRDIIGGLNSWLSGWIDWNIVLDQNGGPNHAKNWCVAPVIVKPEKNEVYYTPLYYAMSHFSKYFRPGAKRIYAQNPDTVLMMTAVKNTDNRIAINILNQEEESHDYEFELNNKFYKGSIEGFCIQTLLIE